MKKLCSIHRYYYNGNECPICMQERVQKMALRWAEKKVDIQKKRLEDKGKHKSMDEMLEKLKQKFNSH